MRRAAKAAAAAKATTLADAYQHFLTLKDRRSSTEKDYRMLWRLHVSDSLKRKPVADITSTDIEKLKVEIGRRTRRTANKVVVLLSAIMSRAGRAEAPRADAASRPALGLRGCGLPQRPRLGMSSIRRGHGGLF